MRFAVVSLIVAACGSSTGAPDAGPDSRPVEPDAAAADAPTTAPDGAAAVGWPTSIGGTLIDRATTVAVDSAGSVVVAGRLAGAVTIQDVVLVPYGSDDAFVAKLTPAGVLLWAKRFGGTATDRAWSVIATDTDDLIVVGSFSDSADFDGTTLTSAGGRDIFMARLSTAGDMIWLERFGGDGDDEARDVAVDSAGNLVVTGSFESTMDFGGSTIASSGAADVFVAKLSSTGAHVWTRRIGGGGTDFGTGIAVDPTSDDIAVSGSFEQSADFGSGNAEFASCRDIFAARYSSSNVFRWYVSRGGPTSDEGGGIVIDQVGNTIFAGTSQYADGLGGTDALVVKVTLVGDFLWQKRFLGGSGNDGAVGLAIDSSAYLYVTGSFSGTASFDEGMTSMDAAGARDVFLAKYGASGTLLWADGYGGPGVDEGLAVASAPDGSAFVVGVFEQTGSFGGGPLTSAGQTDICVVRHAP